MEIWFTEEEIKVKGELELTEKTHKELEEKYWDNPTKETKRQRTLAYKRLLKFKEKYFSLILSK